MQFLKFQEPTHLNRRGIIESGSFYTPKVLVEEVQRMILPYLDDQENIIMVDSSVGGGAFTQIIDDRFDYRLADTDEASCHLLSAFGDKDKVFHSNSLHEVNREKYNIPNDAFLVQVGNPPYNDTTSAYKKGEKGENQCDKDLFDRDLGVSFLKSYDKLNSNLVCVLHPLAYLIKKTNFRRLKNFAKNYQLKDAVVFSSQIFSGTGKAKFPIIIGLYERHPDGMSYEDICDFKFRIWEKGEQDFFQLNKFQTTDGYIGKYPPRKNDIQESPIDLYYYTFRDINSVKRSASFLTEKHYNGIVVTVEKFYQYAYLFAFKTLFNPKGIWLYGNLSPLMDKTFVESNKEDLVNFALAKHPAFKEIDPKHVKAIRDHYQIKDELSGEALDQLEANFIQQFEALI